MDDHLHLTVDYEPSSSTKQLWLSTRKDKNKKEYSFDGFTQRLSMYGLFATHNFRNDLWLFRVAMLLEIAGGIVIALTAGGGLLIFGTLLTSIAIDIILAIGLHMKVGEICRYENEKNVAMNKWQKMSEKFSFTKEDTNNDIEFNRVLWHGLKGDIPFPGPTRAAFVIPVATGDDD